MPGLDPVIPLRKGIAPLSEAAEAFWRKDDVSRLSPGHDQRKKDAIKSYKCRNRPIFERGGLKVPRMLDQMRRRLYAQRSFEAAVKTILGDVIALHGAEYGNVQLPIDDHLVIAAQKGFSAPFLRMFREVRKDTGSACGRALRSGKTVVITDVERDPEFSEYRATAKAAHFRAVQSTPLCTRDGILLGIVSTHFANAHEPTPIEMATLKSYARMAAEYLRTMLGGAGLAGKAQAMSNKLYAALEPEDA